MSNKTINQLDEIETLSDSDELVLYDVSSDETKKVTRANLYSGVSVISSDSTTITGVNIVSGDVVRILFTSAITASDTSTALSLTYNDTAYTVKVGKQGALADFVASYVDSAYTYLQAYTTLELMFDGTEFIIIGNPVVLSSSAYTIYADGQKESTKKVISLSFDSGASGDTFQSDELIGAKSLQLRVLYSSTGGQQWQNFCDITSGTYRVLHAFSYGATATYNNVTLRMVSFTSSTGTITLGQGYRGVLDETSMTKDDTACYPLSAIVTAYY